jgi:hypothetical protein
LYRQAHLAAERVDLVDQMALADSADHGITGHLADMIEVDGEHKGTRSHPGRGEPGFDTAWPAPTTITSWRMEF